MHIHCYLRMCTAWPGDAHTLLLGAGSFIAFMVAGQLEVHRDYTGKDV